MRILLSGASGLVGRNLESYFRSRGESVTRLVRTPEKKPGTIFWSPYEGRLNPADVSGFDAVIHLSGAPVAGARWTSSRKKELRRSRIDTTRLLCQRLMEAPSPPSVFISASAIGYYGDRDDEVLTESSPAGEGFMPQLCHAWEEAASVLHARASIRSVQLRLGLVLDKSGGALSKMLLPFRLGLGAVLGDGRQYTSWIAMDDLVSAIDLIVRSDTFHGPVNLVAPEPVTNRQYSATLANVLKRPLLFSIPRLFLRFALGEMSDILLHSGRVLPAKLIDAGYQFKFPTVRSALDHLVHSAPLHV